MVLALALGSAGCGQQGDGRGPGGLPLGDDDDASGDDDDAPCPASAGAPAVEFVDADHEPLGDGAVFDIARRPQGEVTIVTPLWFDGLEGSMPVSDFLITFIDAGGALLGNRNTGTMFLPCAPDGDVVGDWFEVFFASAGAPVETWDGVTGELTVGFRTEAGDYVEDSIDAALHAVVDGR